MMETMGPRHPRALRRREGQGTRQENDDWNDFVIQVKNKHVTIDFNGTRIMDRTDEKFDDEGVIALQAHVDPPLEIRLKDIEITELRN
jgi:hypothetical protein